MADQTHNTSVLRAVADHSAEAFARHVEEYASTLEWLAQQVRRAGAARPTEESLRLMPANRGVYSDAARGVAHEVEWGLANAGLARLFGTAAEADYAAALYKTARAVEDARR